MSGLLSTAPPLNPLAYLRRTATPLPFPLEEPGVRLFPGSRQGLYEGLSALGLPDGSEILSPAYHHGSEIEALERAGATVRFYAGDGRLEPREDELEALLSPATRALHITHFLGFPQDARRWREWCDQRRLLLIEDCAPAWLSSTGGRPSGSFGDLAVFSLYKQIGIPDGGAAICARPLTAPHGHAPLGLGAALRRHGAWVAQRQWPDRGQRTVPEVDPVEDIALGNPGPHPTAISRFLLPKLPTAEVASRRRENYRTLLERLGEHVPAPFERLPDGASPWMLPVAATDKSDLIRRLAAAGILAVDYWSVPHPSLPVERFPEIAARRERTVALPVHQELRESDLDEIATATLGAIEAAGP